MEPEDFRIVVAMGKPAVEPLIRLLQDDIACARGAAALALTRITHRQYATLAVYLGNDAASSLARRNAVSQYVEFWQRQGSVTRNQWLISDLKSGDREYAKAAAIELGELRATEAIPDLRALLSDSAMSFYAAGALGRLGDTMAVPIIVDRYLTHAVKAFRREGIDLLRSLVGETLGFDPDAPAVVRDSAVAR